MDNGLGSCPYGLNPWVGISLLQEAAQKEKTETQRNGSVEENSAKENEKEQSEC